ncbi:MAG: orotate phosphoribosyltransferase [Cenarchaeum symbiont of Oopsacas minuta]|nr:orotate phosphoribosyltransferase [Cenarchaeum symbiont of Oopsacas minuta]
MKDDRTELADLIEKYAISYSKEPFTLASGVKSHFYFDLRQVSGDAAGIAAIARIMYKMILEIGGIKSIGGLESGSISIAAAISQQSYIKDPKCTLSSFYVRKKVKSHGAKKRIEGRPQTLVAIVDDVITSGNSAIEALDAVKSAGYDSKCLLSIVYRGNKEQKAKIKEYGKFLYIFDEKYFLDRYLKNHKL